MQLPIAHVAHVPRNTGPKNEAFKETLESIVKLRTARDKAVERFKQQVFLNMNAPVVKEEEQLQ